MFPAASMVVFTLVTQVLWMVVIAQHMKGH